MQYHLYRYPGCKWNKHLALINKAKLSPHLPQTELFNVESFKQFCKAHPVFFLKPCLGGGGFGVMKVARVGQRFILYHTTHRKIFTDVVQLYKALVRRCQDKKYIIQQGVDLLHISGRLIDFRVILLKPHDRWEYMGTIGKCAAKNKYVTNRVNGGKVIRFHQAARYGLHYNQEQCNKLAEKLREVSLQIAQALNDTFKNITELGLDIGIDQQGHIWLLEANTKPHFNLFKFHEDQTLYNTITTKARRLRARP